MRISTWLLVGCGTVSCVACTGDGGQSGSEGETPACARTRSHAVGIDEELTVVGGAGAPSSAGASGSAGPTNTARAFFDSVIAAGTMTANLRWYAADGSGSYVDTSVTLAFAGAPTAASYYYDVDPYCSTWVSVDGSILHFQSADGVFDEFVPGNLVSGGFGNEGAHFYGHPNADFSGTYEIAAVTKRFGQGTIRLQTSIGSAHGDLGVQSNDKSVLIASWGENPSSPGGAGNFGGAAGAGGSQAGGMGGADNSGSNQ